MYSCTGQRYIHGHVALRSYLWLWFPVVLAMFLLLPIVQATAQQPAFKCTRLTTADGLSDNMVFCALQDRYGFMWFGTRDGLNKYDGYRFTTYKPDPNNINSLPDAAISCLYEDHTGNIWAGTQNGNLMRFDRQSQRFIRYQDKINEAHPHPLRDPVSSICEDSSGFLWVTTWPPNIGLRKLNPLTGKYVYYYPDKSDPYSISGLPTYVCKDSMGTVWIGTNFHGLNRYDPKHDRFINHRTEPGYSFAYTNEVSCIYAASDGSFWTTDTSRRIYHLSWQKDRFHSTVFQPSIQVSYDDTPVSSVLQASTGWIWSGISNIGLYIFNPVTSQSYIYMDNSDDTYSLMANRIMHVFQDQSSNIWVCTASGINKFHHRTTYFKHFQHKSPSDISNVRSIYKDKKGNLWLGTAGLGLVRVDSNSWDVYSASFHSLKKNTVNTIYQDSSNILWLGTNIGLITFNIQEETFQEPYLHLTTQQIKLWDVKEWRIWSIVEDLSRALWFGTLRQGLYKLDKKRTEITPYLHIFNSRSTKTDSSAIWLNDGAFCSYRDRYGNLWFGTNQGLYKLYKGTQHFQIYSHKSADSTSISHNHVWYIHESGDGTIWLGTSGGGLNALNPRTGSFTHYTEENGLPSNIICGILEDSHNNLWISTNKGLARFNTRSKKVTSFGVGDGLFISEFHFKTCFKDSDGSMYFGGTGGYVHFHPDSISTNTQFPLLAFTSFKVFDRELTADTAVAWKREVRLDHTSNYFSVEFAALDFSNPLKNSYRYRLIGFDEQWRETDGSRPYASYTNVPPGEYTLWLQGSNSDGVWNEKGISLKVIIEPAWWQTWWFKIAVLLMLFMMVAALVWWRYRSLKRRAEVERRLIDSQLQALRSQMNPHFIFNSLNSILHFITTNDPEKAHVYLSKFSKLIRAILEGSRSEFIPLEEEIRVLTLYLELEALRFDNRFSYEIIVDQNIDLQNQQIPPMLLQPHVENAIKHGLIHTVPDGRLEIRIRREGDHIVCSVVDNGIGRKQAQALKQQSLYKHVSRGIALTKDRIEILNSIHSEHYGVEINDLTDDNGISTGTRVDIHITSALPEPE